MTLKLKSREDYAKQHADTTQETFDNAMASADGNWSVFVNDPLIKDDVKVDAAKLYDTVTAGLAGVKSRRDVSDLVNSFNTAHDLLESPEKRALLSAVDGLDNDQVANLLATVRRAANPSDPFTIMPNGVALAPRQNSGGLPGGSGSDSGSNSSSGSQSSPRQSSDNQGQQSAQPAPTTQPPSQGGSQSSSTQTVQASTTQPAQQQPSGGQSAGQQSSAASTTQPPSQGGRQSGGTQPTANGTSSSKPPGRLGKVKQAVTGDGSKRGTR